MIKVSNKMDKMISEILDREFDIEENKIIELAKIDELIKGNN